MLAAEDRPKVQERYQKPCIYHYFKIYHKLIVSEYEKVSKTRLDETKTILKVNEGFSDHQMEQIDKNMIYHKSVAEVRRNSCDLSEKMKPSSINHVESKIQVHFKQRPIDDTPEGLKPKNLRYLENKPSNKSKLPKQRN